MIIKFYKNIILTKYILFMLVFQVSSGIHLFAQSNENLEVKNDTDNPKKHLPTDHLTPDKKLVDDSYEWNMHFRVTHNSISSASAENALKFDNSFIPNRAIGGTIGKTQPNMGNFVGTGYEFGFGVRHNWLFRSNWFIQGATLYDSNTTTTSISRTNFTSSTIFSDGNLNVNSSNFALTNYDNRNRLITMKIGYTPEFFPWNGSSEILSKLSLKFGPELFRNEVDLSSKSVISAFQSTITAQSGTNRLALNSTGGEIDYSIRNKISTDETFLNGMIGVNYPYDFGNKRIELGVDYFKSIDSFGSYKNSSVFLVVPLTSKGNFNVDLEGYRINSAFKWQIWENIGFRLGYNLTKSTYTVSEQSIKPSSTEALGNLLVGNFLGAVVGRLPALGDSPSSIDTRHQLSLDFFLRF